MIRRILIKSLSFIAFFSFPFMVLGQENLDVKGGFFEGQLDSEMSPPPWKSRYEEVRQRRRSRNPRDNEVRRVIDRTLDVVVDGRTSSDVKHGLDAVQNIDAGFEIRNKRIEQNAAIGTEDEVLGDVEKVGR
ncbi:MAG: hypothetical protein IT291_07240 [Deltaproteobacteria bacterium]|nr:hypothetical protein [Deltaproteobacteria bacterium]